MLGRGVELDCFLAGVWQRKLTSPRPEAQHAKQQCGIEVILTFIVKLYEWENDLKDCDGIVEIYSLGLYIRRNLYSMDFNWFCSNSFCF